MQLPLYTLIRFYFRSTGTRNLKGRHFVECALQKHKSIFWSSQLQLSVKLEMFSATSTPQNNIAFILSTAGSRDAENQASMICQQHIIFLLINSDYHASKRLKQPPRVATMLQVAGFTPALWIPGQTLFASTSLYSSLIQRLLI